MEILAKRVREHLQQVREERGDVAMGCVRLEARPRFLGIVFEKPGGSSGQFEASYQPGVGYTVLSPEGCTMVDEDAERVFERFCAIIRAIPEQRRAAIEQKVAEWREQGHRGARLAAMVMSFNSQYEGTRGGELSPEEMRYAARLAATGGNGKY